MGTFDIAIIVASIGGGTISGGVIRVVAIGLTRDDVGDPPSRCLHSPVENFPERTGASRCASEVNGFTPRVLLKVQELENSNVCNARGFTF
jgi:hypothetical protein